MQLCYNNQSAGCRNENSLLYKHTILSNLYGGQKNEYFNKLGESKN